MKMSMITRLPAKHISAISQWKLFLKVLPTRWRWKPAGIEITSLSPHVYCIIFSGGLSHAHKQYTETNLLGFRHVVFEILQLDLEFLQLYGSLADLLQADGMWHGWTVGVGAGQGCVMRTCGRVAWPTTPRLEREGGHWHGLPGIESHC